MVTHLAYDVFLSHNSKDKPEVALLAKRLAQEERPRPFLDEWHLVPGQPFQRGLEEALSLSALAALFFGPHGAGPWHNEEIQLVLDRPYVPATTFEPFPCCCREPTPMRSTGF